MVHSFAPAVFAMIWLRFPLAALRGRPQAAWLRPARLIRAFSILESRSCPQRVNRING
jgi:hypothetical protein